MPINDLDMYSPRNGRLIKEDGTTVNEAEGFNSDGSRNVKVTGSNIAQPTDVQSHYQETIQTHSGVVVSPNNSSKGSWIDADGFDKVGITLMNDATTSSGINVWWSNDGVNTHGLDKNAIASTTDQQKSGILETKARYIQIQVLNGDSATAHTFSSWAYLKA